MGKYVILETLITIINMTLVFVLLHHKEGQNKTNHEECPRKEAEKPLDNKKIQISEASSDDTNTKKSTPDNASIKKSTPDNATLGKLTEEEIKDLKKRAKKIFPKKVEKYAKIMNVTYGLFIAYFVKK